MEQVEAIAVSDYTVTIYRLIYYAIFLLIIVLGARLYIRLMRYLKKNIQYLDRKMNEE